MPGRDVDEFESIFVFEQIDRFLVSGVLHRPAADPIPYVGEDVHPALQLVAENTLDEGRQTPSIFLQLEAPDIPPDHQSSREWTNPIVFLLDLNPKLFGGTEVRV